MASRKVTAAQKKLALEAVQKYGSVTEAAKALNVPRTSLGDHYNLAIQEMPEAVDVGLKQQIDFWKARASKLEIEASMMSRIREEVFSLPRNGLDPPKWVKPKGRSRPKDVPILFTSDFQYGEVVKPAEISGLNAFDNDIARRRYRELIKSTIDICFNFRSQSQYDGIYYLRGGDAISGDIHQELRETNEVTSMVQVKEVAEMEAWGIEQLADAFGKVHVISVAGNHGRSTIKPRAKGYTETNYEYLIALMLEWYFAKDDRITFQTPIAGELLFNIHKTKFLLMHGDMIGSRGGQGFIGPAATIMRGLKKTRDQYAAMQRMFDWLLIGHWHVSMVLPNCVVNGALVGPSEYSIKMLRAEPEAASQTLMFVDPKWGMVEPRFIRLEEPGTTW